MEALAENNGPNQEHVKHIDTTALSDAAKNAQRYLHTGMTKIVFNEFPTNSKKYVWVFQFQKNVLNVVYRPNLPHTFLMIVAKHQWRS